MTSAFLNLTNRGPDGFSIYESTLFINELNNLNLKHLASLSAASILGMQLSRDQVQLQPFVDSNKNILLFNGEIFDFGPDFNVKYYYYLHYTIYDPLAVIITNHIFTLFVS